ncbi:MAG: FHA domain-containing protein [Anaerolineales bacterium]
MAVNAKWLVRTGALLVLVGFFLPTMAVSCSALGTTQSVDLSMANLAGGNQLIQTGDGMLYLIFLGMLLTLAASFVSLIRQDLDRYAPMVEAGGIALSLLVLLAKLIQLGSNAAQLGVNVEPRFGAIFLIVGYIAAMGGVAMEFIAGVFPGMPAYNRGRVIIPAEQEPAQPWQDAPPPAFAPPPELPVLARLEVVGGNLPVRMVQVVGTDFSIGRGAANSLNLPDQRVSRAHVRLRYAQGAWFVQDQNSAIGTYVNGQRVQAGRLNAGDQLKIGDAVFIFRC